MFWLQMQDWTARVGFRNRGVGYQGGFLGSFITAVSVNFRQDTKKHREKRKGWKNAEEKLVRKRGKRGRSDYRRMKERF